MIYCSRGFNSSLSKAEGWSSSNIQFPVRNICPDCCNMVVYCLYKHKLELFLLFFSWSCLFAVTCLKCSGFVLFSRWLDGLSHGMLRSGPLFCTYPVEQSLQDAYTGTRNQRAQQLCGFHYFNLPFRGLGSGWVDGKGQDPPPEKSGPAQQGRHLWLMWGQQLPLSLAAVLQLSLCRGLQALAEAPVFKPFPFQQCKQCQHGEGHILLDWGSSLNAPYLKATWRESPYLLFPVHWGDGGLFLMLQPAHRCRACETLSKSLLWCVLQVFHSSYFGISKMSFWWGKVILQNFAYSRS